MESTDETFMREAIALGEHGRILAPPNPWVASLVVSNGRITGRGFHKKAGTPHAERLALADAGESARGSTVYATLEPCCHHGKTPPCADELIRAGVSRVVVAVVDPDVRVSGKGIERLRQAGIEVTVGVCEREARLSLLPYLHQRETNLPFVLLKSAISMDGRIAAKDGSSQWITGDKARADVHQLRAESQAVIIGSGTALADNPTLTVRHTPTPLPTPQQPLRVLLDSRGRVGASGPLFDLTLAPTLVITTAQAPKSSVNAWRASGAEIEIVSATADGVSLQETLKLLAKRGILQVLVEGGALLQSSFLKQGLVNQLSLYMGPHLLGKHGTPFFQGDGPENIKQSIAWHLSKHHRIDDTVRLDYHFTDYHHKSTLQGKS